MARIQDIQGKTSALVPLETVPGIYVLDLPVSVVKELDSLPKDELGGQLLWLGEKMLRDEAGEKFEDLTQGVTSEEVEETLRIGFIMRIIDGVRQHFEGLQDVEPGN